MRLVPWTGSRTRRSPVAHLVRLLGVLVLVATPIACSEGGLAPEAHTGGQTTYEGTDDGAVHRFLGIRYAQPPTGSLRWAAPVAFTPAAGVVRATTPGPACLQPTPLPGERQDEDCLFLNVTTPRDVRPGEKLPVIVWWHGGGLVSGSGTRYDAARLARDGRVVVVTVNYRLGVMGYLGLPGLPLSGSFGLADQMQSVVWTNDNIAAFGGDPDNISVAGQSAGAFSACALATSPRMAQLHVTHVIVMSGSCSLAWPRGGMAPGYPAFRMFAPVSDIQNVGRELAPALGCTPPDVLPCLRALPAQELTDRDLPFGRIAVGSELLPDDPSRSVGAPGEGFTAVPVLIGGVRDEARAYMQPVLRSTPSELDAAAYPGLLADAFGSRAAAVAARYPLSRYGGSAALAWSAVITDEAWACPTLRDTAAFASRAPTFSYEFSARDGPASSGDMPLGAAHTSDLPFLFDLDGREQLNAEQQRLAGLVVRYWSSFARTGHPEAASGPVWDATPRGTVPRPTELSVERVGPTDSASLHRCNFWNALR